MTWGLLRLRYARRAKTCRENKGQLCCLILALRTSVFCVPPPSLVGPSNLQYLLRWGWPLVSFLPAALWLFYYSSEAKSGWPLARIRRMNRKKALTKEPPKSFLLPAHTSPKHSFPYWPFPLERGVSNPGGSGVFWPTRCPWPGCIPGSLILAFRREKWKIYFCLLVIFPPRTPGTRILEAE